MPAPTAKDEWLMEFVLYIGRHTNRGTGRSTSMLAAQAWRDCGSAMTGEEAAMRWVAEQEPNGHEAPCRRTKGWLVCYLARIIADFKQYVRQFGADISPRDFVKLFWEWKNVDACFCLASCPSEPSWPAGNPPLTQAVARPGTRTFSRPPFFAAQQGP